VIGELLDVSTTAILPVADLSPCLLAIAILYRPLLLSSAVPEIGEARGLRADRVEIAFLVTLAPPPP
jgi:zinc/manganese transport system permease protein